MKMESLILVSDRETLQVQGERTSQVPRFPIQMPKWLPWDLTRAFAVKTGMWLYQTLIWVVPHGCVISQHTLQDMLVPTHRVP